MLRGIGRKYIEMQEARKERADKGEAGFTLIELLVVVIIIGILAAIAIPTFLAQRENAQQASCESDTRNAAAAATSYGASTDGVYTDIGTGDLTANGFNQSTGNTTTVASADSGAGFTITTTCVNGIGTSSMSSANGTVNFTPAA